MTYKHLILLLAPLLLTGAASVNNTNTVPNLVVLTNVVTPSLDLNGDRRTSWPSSGVSGTVVNSGTPVDTAVPIYSGTTGTNIIPSSVTVGSLTNLTVPGKLTVTSGTVTASTPPVDVTQTWNDAGVTFTGLKLSITDTASAAASLLMDLQVGGTSKFKVDKDGSVTSSSTAANSRLFMGGGDYQQYDAPSSGGNRKLLLGSNAVGLALTSDYYLSWSSGTSDAFSSRDLFLRRDAANTLQLGSDSATAAAQVIKGPDGSGTDKVGGSLTLAGGKSTGTGVGGAVVLQTANSSTTGSSANTLSERFHAPAKFVDLTESTATTLFTIPVAAANYVGLTATITIFATDGTDHQALTSTINVNGVAKTTTITPTITQVDGTTAASSGTLTCTYTVTDNTSNAMAVKADAVSSLTQTTLRAKIVITAINSNGAATVTEL